MALQDPGILSMVALNTLSDDPPNSLQRKLVDAIHLRWATGPGIGFPWHGFYLYRRKSPPNEANCLMSRLTNLPPGSITGTHWASGIGTVRSDRPLATRDDFPASGAVEFDLDGRGYLEFLPLEKTFAATVNIGFRADPHLPQRRLNFATVRPKQVPNPLRRLGFTITVAGGNSTNEIIQTGAADGGTSALLMTGGAVVTIDEPADTVDVALIARGDTEVSGRDGGGNHVAGQLLSPPGAAVQRYRVAGQGIGEVSLAVKDPAALLSVVAEGGGLIQLTELAVTAYALGQPIVEQTVTGKPGENVSTTLKADAIDRIRIESGPASLVDLCWYSVVERSRRPWEPLGEVGQPIALPVRHPDYPASGNLPTDLDASRAEALDRITYGDADPWKAPFEDLHEQCLKLVEGGPAIPMDSPARATMYPVEQDPGDTSTPPAVSGQHPLQLTLMAGLHPAIAQMEGLYWSDRTAVPGETYDYLIVADHDGRAGHDASKVLSLVQNEGFANLDGFIVFEKRLERADPLPPPSDARAYALPGSTRPSSLDELQDASCNIGLRWYLPSGGAILLPDSPVLYHPWGIDYGQAPPPAPAKAAAFTPLTPDEPLLVVAGMLSLTGIERPQDWPPFPIYAFDNGIDEGWYGYRISSIDIFGRHSAHGPAARWFEWTPPPDPAPWYYVEPPADTVIHPFAIRLLDKIPPPIPTAVEAAAVDPADPYLQRDAAYTAWFGSLSPTEQTAVVGLRVRWSWTAAQMRQAPDTKEFRIYYSPGRLNSLLGTTTTIADAGAAETLVGTDIANAQPADAYVGCSLKLGPSSYSVVGSAAGTPLEVRARNIGPQNDVRPPPNSRCEINIPNTSSLFVDYAEARAWDERLYVVGFDEHVTIGVDAEGRQLRTYEVLLPAAGDVVREGLSLKVDRAEPIAFGAVAVTAADGRTHSPDDPTWDSGHFGGRAGNESGTSPPALVFRVLREKPEPPVAPPDSEKVFATRADYHGTSYYSFRWVPRQHLSVHVYRAMDDTVFTVDWSLRPRPPLTADDTEVFPPESVEPRWNAAKRQEVAAALNALNAFPATTAGKEQAAAAYRALSNDALRVLAGLPRNEAAFTQITVAPLYPDDPAVANRVGPDNPPDFVVDPSLRMVVDALDGRSTNRFFYRAAYLDGAQNRSAPGLPGPPVWLPSVAAPKTPILTKALGGDQQVTLRWTSNREPDLVDYQVYRTDREEAAQDVRTMTLVHTEPVPAGDPLERPAEVAWIDSPAPGRITLYYRLVAVNDAGNASEPSQLVVTRAFDDTRPAPPTWGAPATGPGSTVRLEWTSPNAGLRCLVQRRIMGATGWENTSSWLPRGDYRYEDRSRLAGLQYVYRLRVLDTAGRTNGTYHELTV